MRKLWLTLIGIFVLACALFVAVYYWKNSPNQTELKLEFNPPPPWVIRRGQNFTITLLIKNNGGVSARNVNVNFTLPKGFTILQSGAHQYSQTLPQLKAGEQKNITLTLSISTAVIPGNYQLNLTISAENAPRLTFKDVITVQLPH